MIKDYHYEGLEQIRLHESISIPSKTHTYSIAVEYMRQWFLDNFEPDYFKTVYINGKHIFDDYRRFNREKLIKVEKPAVAIIPTIDYEYNRDMVDLKLGGSKILTRRSRYMNNNVFEDIENNYFLKMFMELNKINFTYRIRVSTKAQQIELANKIKYSFRVGATQQKITSFDYHLPYEVMLNLAKHNDFEIDYNTSNNIPRIKNITGFLSYINSISYYPVTYKMRNINGNNEFFIRLNNICAHISNLDNLSMDDGEREAQLENNFHIEMNCVLSLPAPQQFIFYSSKELDNRFRIRQELAGLYRFKDYRPPEIDKNGWKEYLNTEYHEDIKVELDKIEFLELIEQSELLMVINYLKSIHISPSIFVNIIIYNNFIEQECEIDWSNFYIIPKQKKMMDEVTLISFYVDLEYLNEQLITLENMNKTRMS